MTVSARRGPVASTACCCYDDHRDLWDVYFATRSLAARNRLVIEYQSLVATVVRLLPASVRDHGGGEDLESFGMFGLIDAVERWRPTARFETYAVARIRGSIYDELRRIDWLPRRVRRRVIAFNSTSEAMTGELGRTPRRGEVLLAAGAAKESEQAELLACLAASRVLHLEHGEPGPDGDGAVELPSEDESLDPEAVAMEHSQRLSLYRAVTELPHQQRVVITLHLLAGLRQSEVAALIGVSSSRVCQVLKVATRSLRERMLTEESVTRAAARVPTARGGLPDRPARSSAGDLLALEQALELEQGEHPSHETTGAA